MAQDIEENDNLSLENNILKKQVKSLEEKLVIQANDLIRLNSLENEIKALRIENKKFEKENSILKKQKMDLQNENLMKLIKRSKFNASEKKTKKKTRKQISLQIYSFAG